MKNEKEGKSEVIDYGNYTYKEDAVVEISGSLFLTLRGLVMNKANKEVKKFYNISAELSPEDYHNQKPMIYTSEEGMALIEVVNELNSVHMENVDKGKAITYEELNKPALELVKP